MRPAGCASSPREQDPLLRGGTPTPGAPEKAAVRSMFDRIAPRYDLLNRLLSARTDVRWRKAALDYLERTPPLRLLDLCTGTADLLVEGLERSPANHGVGLDLSFRMLELAGRKLRRRGLEARGAVALGDAERLPLAPASFDAVLVAFGIRNVGEPAAALVEMRRVLRTGGRLVVLEFSMPRGVAGALYRFYFEHVLPRIGRLVSGDRGAYAYLPASVGRFPAPPAFAALLESCGFQDVAWRPLSGGIACLFRAEKRP